MNLSDLYGSSSEGAPEPKPVSRDLPEELSEKAKAAAEAHDAASAARAAMDDELARAKQELEQRLKPLADRWKEAQKSSEELRHSLKKSMEKAGVTSIPMVDRPEIKIKTTRGRKRPITKRWLTDPEEITVRSFDAALSGEKPFTSGHEAAREIWNSAPREADKSEVEIPDRYQDEPDGI